ncbi:tail X family protein [Tepidicaulis marinus]|uniref:Tail X family protein n=1 Tax=Tepidicaulis marinus TaxID=1333998 RepID=A0A081B6C1_9HYPH|nr:tail protein X [Tepidicaulis marinus]GAK43589.1 tail X family protein [Tepidicaulis marinus]
MSRLYRTSDGDMVDFICWKHYGVQSGAVEAVLEANEGLAALGPRLPAGVTITLPDLRPKVEVKTVRLWD